MGTIGIPLEVQHLVERDVVEIESHRLKVEIHYLPA
jgi:hypothetical protein